MQIKLKMIIVTLMTIITEPTDGNGHFHLPAEKQRIYVKVDCEIMMIVVMQILVMGVMMSTWLSKGV